MTFRRWILKRYLYFAIRKSLLMIFPSFTKPRFGAARLFVENGSEQFLQEYLEGTLQVVPFLAVHIR